MSGLILFCGSFKTTSTHVFIREYNNKTRKVINKSTYQKTAKLKSENKINNKNYQNNIKQKRKAVNANR